MKRWGALDECKHGDIHTCTDRYNPGVLQKHKWENAMTLDLHSFGYRLVSSKYYQYDVLIKFSDK